MNLGCSVMLLKKRNTAFYARTCTVAQLEITYKKLVRVFISTFNAHLSIYLKNISALEKIMFVCSKADSTLLRHAYTTFPYCRTLVTSAFTNYTFTLTFEIPNSLQLDLIAQKVLFDLFILACNKHSGFLLLLDNISPRYLNSLTVSAYFSPIFKISLQFMYMALVFLTFTCRSFSVQNYTKQSISSYNSVGEGASSTKSSAKVSKNNYTDAIVYARLLLPGILCLL